MIIMSKSGGCRLWVVERYGKRLALVMSKSRACSRITSGFTLVDYIHACIYV